MAVSEVDSFINFFQIDYLNEVQIEKEDMNEFVALTPLTQRKKLERASFLTFDTETKDGLKGKELFCWSLCYAKPKNKSKDIMEKCSVASGNENLDELFEFLKAIKQKHHTNIIFVHNLGFDIRFIADYCSKHKIQIMPIISGSNMIACMINSLKVKFVDTFQFLFCSQDKAEKEWNVPLELTKIDCNDLFNKKFEEWSKEDKERVIAHNKNDVRALYHIMNEFRHTMFEISNVDILQCISLATLSMKALRKTLEKSILNPMVYTEYKADNIKRKVVYAYNENLDSFIRSSYFGGRCEVFNKNIVENVSYVDKVSMYPFVMKNKKYPIGIGIYEESYDTLMKCIRSSGKYAIVEGFIKCNVVPNKDLTKYPILPEKRDKKTTFSNCFKDEKVFTLPELRKAYIMGYGIEPIVGYLYYQSDFIFEKFVDKFYKVKSENKGGKRNCAKITLNSSYGKFGQAFKRVGGFYTYFSDKKKFEKATKELNNAFQFWNNESKVGWITERKESISIKPYMNVSIASYVTSYARLELWEQLHFCELNRIEVYYADTDSFVIETKNLSKIELKNELGGWQIEKTFEKAEFLALKAYIYQSEGKLGLKLKGVDRDKIKEIVDSSKSIEEIELKIKEPIQMAEKYMKFTEAHRSGLILNTKQLCKHYSYESMKRQFLPNGTSIAWDVNSIKPYKVLCC